MQQHDAVSSEEQPRPAGRKAGKRAERAEAANRHEAVSSEGPEGAVAVSQADDSVGESGELEAVEGFDPTRTLREAPRYEEVEVTEALETLPEPGTLEFEEPETVCGNDDRVQICPATSVPWRWSAQLLITMANGNASRCTGWFIGPRTVMTAGHCVYSHAAGGWAQAIEVIPGMCASQRPFGSQVGTSFRSVAGWVNNSDPEYDYGAIILPDNSLGNLVGYFGFAVLSDSQLNNLLVNNAGYAGDKPFGTLWFNAGPITQVTARRLQYFIDTFGGHSGSAIWWLINGHRYGVGIHGYGGCPNKAVRIIQPVFNNMLAWRNLGF
jgi:glutamyl endopeptidase